MRHERGVLIVWMIVTIEPQSSFAASGSTTPTTVRHCSLFASSPHSLSFLILTKILPHYYTSTGQSQQQSAAETKKQRQNAARREAEKAQKSEAEKERLAKLTKHKRDLENERMKAQFAKGGK